MSFKSVSLKAIAVVIAVVLFAVLLLAYQDKANKLDKVVIEKEQTTQVLEEVKSDAAQSAQSAQATDTANVEIGTELKKDQASKEQVREQLNDKLKELDAKYGDGALSEVQKVRKNQEEQVIRATAQWRVFCIRYPSEKECEGAK